jgi:hypothetical protein
MHPATGKAQLTEKYFNIIFEFYVKVKTKLVTPGCRLWVILLWKIEEIVQIDDLEVLQQRNFRKVFQDVCRVD